MLQWTRLGWAADIQVTEAPDSRRWREQILILTVKPHLLPTPPGNTELLSPLPVHPGKSQDQVRHSSCIVHNVSSDSPRFHFFRLGFTRYECQHLDPTSAFDTKAWPSSLNSVLWREHERRGRKTKCALGNSWLLSFLPRPSWRWEQLDTFAHATPEKVLWNLACPGLGGEGGI